MPKAISKNMAVELLSRRVSAGTPLNGWPTQAPHASASTIELAAELHGELMREGAVTFSLPDVLSDSDLTVATWNLVTLLAYPVPQYETGELLYPVEVRADGGGASHYSATAASGGLHTDGSLLPAAPDLALLMCLSAAESGGETVLVDAAAVHEHLTRSFPELLDVLFAEHPFLAPGRPGGSPRWKPIFSHGPDGNFKICYLRRYLETGWSASGSPIPQRLKAAMDAIDEFTLDGNNQRPYLLHRSEALIWRNDAFIHGRRAFDQKGSARRLIRIYADTDKGRPVHVSRRGPTRFGADAS
ncbi:TauD/TfdA family dioxygenase [Nonomuraea wenchangensis]|uniref:TauD/TfdA family dioxygenase n=1 Tax=Nonomuraea wenchangensis TaxID=568860 RepID=UPI00384ED199